MQPLQKRNMGGVKRFLAALAGSILLFSAPASAQTLFWDAVPGATDYLVAADGRPVGATSSLSLAGYADQVVCRDRVYVSQDGPA